MASAALLMRSGEILMPPWLKSSLYEAVTSAMAASWRLILPGRRRKVATPSFRSSGGHLHATPPFQVFFSWANGWPCSSGVSKYKERLFDMHPYNGEQDRNAPNYFLRVLGISAFHEEDREVPPTGVMAKVVAYLALY